jgi:hypothetical protein
MARPIYSLLFPEEVTSAKIAQVRIEGDGRIEREVLYYNLDVIMSVVYRILNLAGIPPSSNRRYQASRTKIIRL